MAVGAIGYLPKSISAKRLPAVVRAVLLGEPAIPRPLVAVLMNRLRGAGAKRHLVVPDGRGVDLTSREWEVLDCMREGLSTREIAAKLLIADVTVRRHIGAVLKKLHEQSRREAPSFCAAPDRASGTTSRSARSRSRLKRDDSAYEATAPFGHAARDPGRGDAD